MIVPHVSSIPKLYLKQCFNPSLLYAVNGIKLNNDGYDIGIGKEHRDVVKQAFNAMVQAKSKLTTPPKDIDWKSTGRTWKELRQLILDKHEPIKDSFFCGMGNRLQFRDSQLAEQIMLHLSLIHISEPTRLRRSRMPSSA